MPKRAPTPAIKRIQLDSLRMWVARCPDCRNGIASKTSRAACAVAFLEHGVSSHGWIP